MKKKLFIIIFVTNLFTSNSFSIEPDIFVQSTVNRASKLLSESISKEEKIKELRLIAKDTVDIRGIGFYTLGPARKNLSEENKIKYFELFEQYFLKSFSSRLAEYTNPEIDVYGKEVLNKNYTRPLHRNRGSSWHRRFRKRRRPTPIPWWFLRLV